MKKEAMLLSIFLVGASLAIGQPQETTETKAGEPEKEHKSERVALRDLEGNDISIMAKNSFREDFPNITDVHWNRSENFDEASFTNNESKKLKAFYDDDGVLIGTTQNVTFADLPLKGQLAIKNKYKDYKIGDVIFFNDNLANESDMILWSSQFNDEDNYFVELIKGNKKLIVRVATYGTLSFFKELT